MTTIYRANNARLSVAEAKRLISDAAPRSVALGIYATIDERGNIDFDGPIERRLDKNANITRTYIDDDFPALCERLGVVPTNKFRPALTGYPSMPELDESWTIAHDEFVKLAALHGLLVEIGDAPERPAPPVVAKVESIQQRQDRRLRACIDAGLPMNEKAALVRLPDGVGKVAEHEGVTRQAFSTDVKAALKRRESAKREGQIVRQR